MCEKIWLKSYPKKVRSIVDTGEFNSIPELMENRVQLYKDLDAFQCMGKVMKFSELDVYTQSFASYIQHYTPLKKGDKIAIQMPNLLQYPVAMYGALRAGLIVVSVNPLYTPSEMLHQLKDAETKAIVILENFADKLEEIIDKTEIQTVITTRVGDMLGLIKGSIVNFVVKHFKKMVPSYCIPSEVNFKDTLSLGIKKELKKIVLKQDDTAYLQYTGGSTGVPKGAVLTHGNLIANLLQVLEWMNQGGIEKGEETFITALPMYHIFALTCNALVSVNIGAKNILIINPRDMKAFIKELKSSKFSVLTGVNTLFNGLLNHPDFKNVDFSNVKFSFAGGMPLQSYVAKKWMELTDSPISEGYGLTETSPVLTINPLRKDQETGYVGLPISNTEIKMIDDEGNDVPVGQPGEICVKGPQVFSAYWKNQKETDNVFLDGWFKTGDIATMNERGYIKIVDRKKEMILVSGFNVYPNEIEEYISRMDEVLEIAAIGVPDSDCNEKVKVFIKKSNPELTEQEVIKFCRKGLTGYKIPKIIEFIDEFPKTNVGKILKRVLKEEDLKKNKYT